MEYTVIFFTHSGAIKFDRKLKSKHIKCELMPVPRKLSSNCGIGAKMFFDGNINDVLDDEVDKIYLTENDKNELVYKAE